MGPMVAGGERGFSTGKFVDKKALVRCRCEKRGREFESENFN